MITLDEKAWEAGYAAGLRGGYINSSCPYPPKTLEALSWRSGFIEGKARRVCD